MIKQIEQRVMQGLLDTGQAVALLQGHFPVPTRYEGSWWRVPAHAAPDAPFERAPCDLAGEFDDLYRRHRAADDAVQASGH